MRGHTPSVKIDASMPASGLPMAVPEAKIKQRFRTFRIKQYFRKAVRRVGGSLKRAMEGIAQSGITFYEQGMLIALPY
ncbi:hypothetical protein MMC25_007355 [Agyrium rufum]|nr:hypothetical protein [Agyrium rufum]